MSARSWAIAACAACASCAPASQPRARHAVAAASADADADAAVVAIPSATTSDAQAAAPADASDASGPKLIDEVQARLAKILAVKDRPPPWDDDDALPQLARLLHWLGFPDDEVSGWGQYPRVVGGELLPVNLDADPDTEYVLKLETKDDPSVVNSEDEPSSSLFLVWIDATPSGFGVVGRRSFTDKENGYFLVSFEPFHDKAYADTTVTTNWSHMVNVSVSGTNIDVVTLGRGKFELIAHVECGTAEVKGAPPKKIVCDHCIPQRYAGPLNKPPVTVPCADRSKPTLVWDATKFAYR